MLILASEYLLTKFPPLSFYVLKPYSCISTNSTSSIKHYQPIPIAFFLWYSYSIYKFHPNSANYIKLFILFKCVSLTFQADIQLTHICIYSNVGC